MIKFQKPVNLNGDQLLSELNAAGIAVNDFPVLDGNEILWLDINANDIEKAKNVVSAHDGKDNPKVLTISDKLASIGLSIDELKSALLGAN